MARAIVRALDVAGIKTDVVSTLQLRDGRGDTGVQSDLMDQARSEVARLVPLGRQMGLQLWITYHSYYKAPDLIGPHVARALSIPYVQIEATRARKRLEGPWASFARAAEEATDAARIVFYLTRRDAEALDAYKPQGQKLVHLRPFLPRHDLPEPTDGSAGILAVGMFRSGDKLASYQLIAETLARLREKDWTLEIAGDGPERDAVRALMEPYGARVRFLGALDVDQLQAAYGRARLLFWPGVNEAFGMNYLEGQAAGLPVVAQDRPGVRDVLCPQSAYPAPHEGADGLAARLDLLLGLPKLVQHLGTVARGNVARYHLMGPARDTLRDTVEELFK